MLRRFSHSRNSSADNFNHHISKRSTSIHSNHETPLGYGLHKRNISRSSTTSISSNFLAEQYERDRRFIIQSCFQKVDTHTGLPLNSYITHVRVTEDPCFPSSRAPSNLPQVNKKKRVLILSSRPNGLRMQLHKARENENNGFQIGRSWELKEVVLIERDTERPEGFILVMGKRYYWETNSSKERTVFIKSLVRVYMEDSGGRVPRLINWDLSMFYLDEQSYNRALIGSLNHNSQVTNTLLTTVKEDLVSAQHHVSSKKAIVLSPTSKQGAHPYKDDLKASKYQGPPSEVYIASNNSSQSSHISTVISDQQTKDAKPDALQFGPVTPSNSAVSIGEAENAELSNSLRSPTHDVNFISRQRSYHDVELETESKPNLSREHEGIQNDSYSTVHSFYNNEGPNTIRQKFNSSSNSFSDQVDNNDQVPDNEDERNNNSIPTSHVNINKSQIVYPENRGKSFDSTPNITETLDTQMLLEVLDEINWDISDDAITLLERLYSKISEAQYNFNRELLNLPSYCKDLSKFQSNIMNECDKLDPTLSFFSMELATLSQDIEFVENQSNGLQVESANKKSLWKELTAILKSVSIDEVSLQELLTLPLDEKNLNVIEKLLTELYTALKAIRGKDNKDEYDLGEIRALKERREAYERITSIFSKRAIHQLERIFDEMQSSNDKLIDILSRILIFSSIPLFCKNISKKTYTLLINSWNKNISKVYDVQVSIIISNLESKTSTISTSQLQMISNQVSHTSLFGCWEQYKQSKTLEFDLPETPERLDLFLEAIESIQDLCINYQNFVDYFFHLSSDTEFSDYIKTFEISSRILSLDRINNMESNRESAFMKNQISLTVFQQSFSKFTTCIGQILRNDPNYIPAILLYLENKIHILQFSDQEFLLDSLTKIFDKVKMDWQEFLDEQTVYLERAVINHKTGTVSPSILRFPAFVKNTEDILFYVTKKLSIKDISNYSFRKFLDKIYQKLAESMVDLLVKEDIIEANQSKLQDSNISQQLERCVSLIVNSNWLIEMLPIFSNDVFLSAIQRAKLIFDEEKDHYADFLLKENMSKLIRFVEGACGLTNTDKSVGEVDPSRWAAYSQQNLDKILLAYNSKTIDSLVAELYKHMKSQFMHEPNDMMREHLCDKLWSCIQGQTVSFYLKLYTMIDKHYKGTHISFTKNDVIISFNKHKKN